jgi:hypothetical protein
MANGARDAEGADFSILIQKAFDAEDCVQLEQGNGRGRIIQVDLFLFYLRHEVSRERVHVDLETNGQGGFRTHAGADPAEFLPEDCVVKFQSITPKRFIPKRVKAEDLTPFLNHPQPVPLSSRQALVLSGSLLSVHCSHQERDKAGRNKQEYGRLRKMQFHL